MIRALALLLPALIPSWKFFRAIEPSPRIEWRWVAGESESGNEDDWRPFRPCPAHLSFVAMLAPLFWNPHWNETLYSVSLAERLSLHPTSHSIDEIFRLLSKDIVADQNGSSSGLIQFRLVFVHRQGEAIVRDVTYQSETRLLDGTG